MIKPFSVRLQLLLIVNLTLGLLLAGLLVWEYRREMADHLADKHADLDDEAIAVHQAVAHLLRGHGVDDVQQYVDTVCSAMQPSRVRCADPRVWFASGLREMNQTIVLSTTQVRPIGVKEKWSAQPSRVRCADPRVWFASGLREMNQTIVLSTTQVRPIGVKEKWSAQRTLLGFIRPEENHNRMDIICRGDVKLDR